MFLIYSVESTWFFLSVQKQYYKVCVDIVVFVGYQDAKVF